MDKAYPRIIPVKQNVSGLKCLNSIIRIFRTKLAVIPGNIFVKILHEMIHDY